MQTTKKGTQHFVDFRRKAHALLDTMINDGDVLNTLDLFTHCFYVTHERDGILIRSDYADLSLLNHLLITAARCQQPREQLIEP